MNTPLAIAFTIGLYILGIVISVITKFPVMLIIILITSLWVAIDSARIHVRQYKTGISFHPIVLFIACLSIWIVGFPWYLSVRHKIKTGVAPKIGDTGVVAGKMVGSWVWYFFGVVIGLPILFLLVCLASYQIFNVKLI